MKFFLVLAAAATLGSAVALAADDAAPAAPAGKGACKADILKFCNGVEHGNGKIRACLAEHSADLSDPCKQRMAAHDAKSK
jgi:hypothetical protein